MRTAERKMELGLIATEAAPWQQMVAGSRKGFMTFLRRIANRISANRLVEMDDHQLADIGLTRSDLTKSLNISLLEDPTTRLARCARMAAAKAL